MSSRGVWYAIQSSIPSPAWVRWPEQQRFCCCCSIRTGASVIGWFNFVINSLYAGMLVFVITQLRNLYEDRTRTPSQYEDLRPATATGKDYTVHLPNGDDNASGDGPYFYPSEEQIDDMEKIIEETLPIMYKSVAIPAIMIIFSIFWLISVEARTLAYVRLFGKAFMAAIIIQIIMQLGFLGYADHKSRSTGNVGISWVLWLIFAIYALLNLYFVPVLREYISRRVKEERQGLEQGLLTSEMHPKARVAEEYIEDAFTLEGDADVVQFQASLESENNYSSATRDIDDYQPL